MTQELTPQQGGRWVVTTRSGTRHVFDLDTLRWTRLPAPGSGGFPDDDVPVRLTRIQRWPVVGGTFLVWTDFGFLHERWHQSSTIASIEPDTEADLTGPASESAPTGTETVRG